MRSESRKGTFEKVAAEVVGQGQNVGDAQPGMNAPPVRPRGPANQRFQGGPEPTSVSGGRSIEQMGMRPFHVDATLGDYFNVSFPNREVGQTLSPYVAFIRQFEASLINEVAEKHELLASRVGPGSDQSRASLAVRSSLNSFSKESEMIFGTSLTAFNVHFCRALEGKRREITAQVMDWGEQALVAAQLKVQAGTVMFMDPETNVVSPAHAIRVPLTDGGTATYGFSLAGSVRQRHLQLVDASRNASGFIFEPKDPKDPAALGLPELAEVNGAIRGNVVQSLREEKGVVFVTHAVVPRDLLAGTVLDEQDGGRIILANIMSEGLQAVIDAPEIEQVLSAPAVSGSAEVLRQADQMIAAVLVTMARVDASTQLDMHYVKDGSAVDPVVLVVEAIRKSISSLARKDGLAELAKTVQDKIRSMGEGLGRYVDPQNFQDRMKKDLMRDLSWGGDVFESVSKVMTLAMDGAGAARKTKIGGASPLRAR